MKILYLSTFCSQKFIDKIFDSSKIKPGQAVQKFHRLLIEGFAKNSEICEVELLSSVDVAPNTHDKRWWNLPNERWNGIDIHYVPFLNYSVIKHFFVFYFTILYVMIFAWRNRKQKSVIICDILNHSMAWGAFIAAKILGHKMVVIVTDLPMFMGNQEKKSIFEKLYLKISSFVLHRFDFYIGLTKQMNEVINPFNKPFLVMEGLVDGVIQSDDSKKNKGDKKILIYAGGIYEKYGVGNLIRAFMQTTIENTELHIYGSGDLEDQMLEFCRKDKRVCFFGVVKNEVVVEKLENATLLINPRPTDEEFTKFSFPSKNMEYMVSGTPLLTTKLLGMPKEYYDYVFLIQDESVKGIKKMLNEILCKSDNELRCFGNKAQEFVIENKSNVAQCKRILDFLSY